MNESEVFFRYAFDKMKMRDNSDLRNAKELGEEMNNLLKKLKDKKQTFKDFKREYMFHVFNLN